MSRSGLCAGQRQLTSRRCLRHRPWKAEMPAPHTRMNAVPERPPLLVSISDGEQSVAVRLVGELDVATTPQAEEAVDNLGQPRGRLCVLDMRALSFCDSSGVHMLNRLAERAEADGWTLMVLRPSAGPMRRINEICAVHERVIFVDSPPAEQLSRPKPVTPVQR